MSNNPPKTLLDAKQLTLLAEMARAAGEAIMQYYQGGELAIERKADDSPVTAADLASHAVLQQALAREFPTWPQMSEEAADIPWAQRQGWETYWLIDPLDGTKEFIKGNGEFTVNIALIHRGQAVAGVVYVPATAVCYLGALGLGAWRETPNATGYQRVELNARAGVKRQIPVIVGSRSHSSPGLGEYLQQFGEHEMKSVGSSLKFCLLAEGKADIYPRLGPTSEWDTAAAQAVLESAGGRVLEYPAGNNLKYNQKETILNPWFIAYSADWPCD
ncbi:MAG: 3'(2'),5'-bisphosphate nucleotidase CysQ [Shewanella algae]